jgi:uncharacterized Zn-finger protein
LQDAYPEDERDDKDYEPEADEQSSDSQSEPEATEEPDTEKPKKNHVVELTIGPDGKKKTRKYKCTISDCNRTFNSKTAIRYHEMRHSGNRPYVCETCNKAFLTSSALKVHMRLHSGEKPYKVSIQRQNINECIGHN